jgi:hypothetical protein
MTSIKNNKKPAIQMAGLVGVSEPFFGYGSKTGLYMDIGFT